MNYLKKIMAYYIPRILICTPMMLLFFAFSAMLYDSGIPDNYLYHCQLVFMILWIILSPLLLVIAISKKSFNLKGINISYGLNYLIGGVVAFVPAFIISLIHLSPSNFIELILAVLTPILVIITFCILNYIYNEVSIIKKITKIAFKSLVIFYIGYSILLSFFANF